MDVKNQIKQNKTRCHMSKFLNWDVFMSLKLAFILAHSADPDKNPDEMPSYAAFHLGLYIVCQSTCLPVSRMKWVEANKTPRELPLHQMVG